MNRVVFVKRKISNEQENILFLSIKADFIMLVITNPLIEFEYKPRSMVRSQAFSENVTKVGRTYQVL